MAGKELKLSTTALHNTQTVIGRCQKKHNEEESPFKLWSRLPEEMLIQVLIRLPSKNATIFKLVSKRWCALISGAHFISNFITLHRQRFSSDTPKSFTLVFQRDVSDDYDVHRVNQVNLVEAASKSYKNNVVNLDLLLPWITPNYEEEGITDPVIISADERAFFVLRASCHDLVLFSRRSTYYVVNMLTRQWIVLPTRLRIEEEETLKLCPLIWGHTAGILCYTDDKDKNGDGWYRFKVILVPITADCYSPENLQKSNIIENFQNSNITLPVICSPKYSILIFCSETRRWTKVIVDWYPLNWNYSLSSILSFNRMVHWLAGRSLVSLDLFSGDPNLSLTHVIKLPDEFVIDWSLCFGVCMGCLRVAYQVVVVGIDRVIHIWELEDWSRGSCSLAHTILPSKHKLSSNLVKLTAFHPYYDRDIVFLREEAKVHLYNMQREELKQCSKLDLGKNYC